ncbi:zinc-binding dehydrogenase [Kiritimatiellota bacterium B12222]|nr:zinc-binding dehydrogenase [Kiritimatiellota bacterium B12222]
MTTSQPQRIVFRQKQEVELESFDLPTLQPQEVQLRCQCSLMSTGTENIVFNCLFDKGTHWDNWVKFPFYPGYAAAGIVEAIGSDVTTLQVGDRVGYRAGHSSHAVVNADACYMIPKEIPSEQALWFALAKITFQGAMAAKYSLGDRVLVIGAGPIGQMSLRWARVAGAKKVFVVDPVAERKDIAITGGASAYFATPANDAREGILQANNDQLPNVVIDSTGHPAVFAVALDLADRGGRVVLMGDTGQPASQTLTGDVVMKGLTITGAHDGHKYLDWDEAAITSLFFTMVRDGRFNLDGLNTHEFTPDQCVEAYTVANRDRAQTMGILFNWK